MKGVEQLFHGEYMSQYTWGEYRIASLLRGGEDQSGD